MVFDHIEELKRNYTDRWVVVDDSRAELRRFRGQTGRVKTVNMSGRALVEFDAHANIGWYDIDVACLKFVAEPPAREAAGQAAKPESDATKGKAAPAKATAAPQAAAAKGTAPKGSTADILAAARGAKAPAAPPAKATPTESKENPTSAKSPAKPTSTADILAAARGGTAAAPKPLQASAPANADEVPAAPPIPSPVPQVETPAPAAEKPALAAEKPALAAEKPTTTAEIVAFCRRNDAR